MPVLKPCRYVPGYGHYLPGHELNCHDRNCDGCQPCTHHNGNPVRHCTARTSCGQHLDDTHPQTCVRCIGRARDDINTITRGALELPDEVIEANAARLAAGYAPKKVIR